MEELYIKSDKLIPKQEWETLINKLDTIPSKKLDIKDALIQAIKNRLPKEKFGIFFSGGIDSTIIAFICKQLKADFICYTVGIENSDDLIIAKKVAKKLNLNLKTKLFTLEEMHELFKKLKQILPRYDIVSMGVGSVVYAATQIAKEDNIKSFFSGLGSEEIFAGYQRHEESKDINQECWNGLKLMHERDLERDITLAKHFNINILTPFLDKDLIQKAMSIPAKQKINNNFKKVILREVAEEMGLLKEFAWRKKKAAQYGSKFDRAILRLAKRNGFKYKKDYLNSL